jgi:hypothetical protein
MNPSLFPRMFELAHKAGMLAVAGLTVEPMTVMNSDTGQRWFIEDGVCGFAWVTIRPANCAFAKWMKKVHGCHLAYGGGMQYWISDFNQSMQKKEAYADAFAHVLNEFDIHAYAASRID